MGDGSILVCTLVYAHYVFYIHSCSTFSLTLDFLFADPCEAAVDKPLLYQEWGKQQTYIVAFRAPAFSGVSASSTATTSATQLPLIEDVTSKYTSDHVDEIRKRRDESSGDINDTVGKITNDLERQLKNILR